MQKDEIQQRIINGGSVSLSIDTSVFAKAGYRLERGLLKHLEQFKNVKCGLVLSDVVLGELRSHMVKAARTSHGALMKAAGEVSELWQIPDAEKARVIQALLGTSSVESKVEERLQAFLGRCGAQSISAHEHLEVSSLLERYFGPRPPFERVQEKKYEFPDAIALLSIENWAHANKTCVIVTSADKGWASFAQQSRCICWVESLDEAIAMLQLRDVKRAELTAHVAKFIDSEEWSGFEAVTKELGNVNWEVQAHAAYDFDVDMEVVVREVKLASWTATDSILPVDYDGTLLTVSADLVAELEVDAHFVFSLESVVLGGLRRQVHVEHPFEAILTFRNPHSAAPVLTDVELSIRSAFIKFGDVEPDYDDEFSWKETD